MAENVTILEEEPEVGGESWGCFGVLRTKALDMFFS